MVQLISQLRGYFYVNPILALSLAITIFSFVGVPPLIGFFAKQMVLSAALDSGYVFLSLVAILTSVISAYYYLAVVKQMFFNNSDYSLNHSIENVVIKGKIVNRFSKQTIENVNIKINNINNVKYFIYNNIQH